MAGDIKGLTIKFGADTTNLKKGVNEVGKEADNVGSKFKNFAADAAKAVAGAVTAVSAALVGFAKEAVSSGMEFDASMAQVAATMGTTVDQIEELRDFAQEMGAKTAFSAVEAADALNYMALAGYDAEMSMTMLPNVLNLAAAGGIELAAASDMVTDAQTALGLTAEETSYMVDQMAKASSKSNTSVEQLGEAILTIGANAKQINGGTTELTTMLGVLADNGIKGTEAGTHLRNIMLAMNPTTKKAKEAWEELGVSAYDAEGNLRAMPDILWDLNEAMDGMTSEEKTSILTKMFNKTDLASINALLDTSYSRFDELRNSVQGAWYSVEGLSSALESKSLPSLEEMQENLAKLGVSAEDFNWVLNSCEGSAGDFANYLWECTDAGVEYDDIANALGGDVMKLAKAFNESSGAAQAMADTQLDNLAGDITLFESALEGLKIAVSDSLTPILREFVQFGSSAISELTVGFQSGNMDQVVGAIGKLLNELFAKLTEMIPKLVSAAATILGIVIPQVLDTAKTFIEQNASTFLKGGVELFTQLASGIVSMLPSILGTLADIVVEMAEYIIELAPGLLDSGVELVDQLVTGIIDSIPEIINTSVKLLVSFINTIGEKLPSVLQKGTEILTSLIKGIIDAIPQLIAELPKVITAIIVTLVQNLPQIISSGIQIIVALITGLIEALPQLRIGAYQVIKNVVEEFGNYDWSAIGKNIIDGLIQGLKNTWEILKHAVEDTCEKVGNAFKDFFGIESPSKWMRDNIGKNMMTGLEVGMDKYSKDAIAEAGVISNALQGAFAGGVNGNLSALQTSYSRTANLNLTTPVILDGRVIATVVNNQLGVLL